jgi:Tol biopolymer transport system component
MKRTWLFFALVSTALLAACGTSSTHFTPPPPPPVIKVAITPTTTTSVINQSVQFSATVTGTTNKAVTWTVKESAAGTVKEGLYQAPVVNGTYHVVATSVADPTKSASAEVAVSAPFLFIQQADSVAGKPFSVTPVLGTFGADTKFTLTNINDSSTGKPIVDAIEDIFLSADGTKAVFTLVSIMTNPDSSTYWVENIYVADVATGTITQLTDNTKQGQYFWRPQFTPDGKQIVYLYYDWANSTTCDSEIWMMNADGSNQHVVYASCTADEPWSDHPSVSPDGSKIVAEVDRYVGESWYDGIAIMNIDGTNIVQLTGGSNETCANGGHYYWDENPSFSADGKQIFFARHCDLPELGCTLSIYKINVDGTGLQALVNADTKVYNTDPLVVGDKVVFSSDRDTPRTGAFDIYSMKADGSGITRLTNNMLFDAFTSYYLPESAAKVAQSRSQKRAGQTGSGVRAHHKH